jgi:hypothetical protein
LLQIGPRENLSHPPLSDGYYQHLIENGAPHAGFDKQIDAAAVFQGVVVEVDELLRAEVERLLTVGGASGADDAWPIRRSGLLLSCQNSSFSAMAG